MIFYRTVFARGGSRAQGVLALALLGAGSSGIPEFALFPP
eukprot:CAMPEP_0174362876 /NCGR_PEP_ID=MMETSP0811_2-20130205/66585_1 /TAXON_ID=73025 ORGANISM="Eutreptiella gymnastica-like, Strain CCMP1594" /NCGR_SAMPLE_ID=MMETSP0811_2 /ASSEMBLY_ACC=CAM_ASM_000667 /LENGTH=39 /DNA_ID= /DNA_START= /DNA_END= /DNA_ORIENTATION=